MLGVDVKCPIYLLITYFTIGQLIYEWEQSLEEVNIFIRPPTGVTAGHLLCNITANHLTLGMKGSADRFLDVR